MSLFFGSGSVTTEMSVDEVKANLFGALAQLGERRRVLAVPPDFTRSHSGAGALTELCFEFYGNRLLDVLPALGTHRPMTDWEIERMFGRTPRELFRVHDWRRDVVTLGEVPGEFMREVSEGKLGYTWPAEVNRLLRDGPGNGGQHDLIVSIGQVVPHEVVGFANGSKNILIGTGGVMGIHRSHFLGAVYGMERMMGRVDTPVRRVLNYATEHFGAMLPPIVYVQTVVGKNPEGRLVMRGMFVGDDRECFERAAALSLQCNFERVDREIRKAVVYLDPGRVQEYVAGKQERLPDADGDGRWGRAGGAGAGGAGVRGGSYDRSADSAAWVLRDAADA